MSSTEDTDSTSKNSTYRTLLDEFGPRCSGFSNEKLKNEVKSDITITLPPRRINYNRVEQCMKLLNERRDAELKRLNRKVLVTAAIGVVGTLLIYGFFAILRLF
jgi:hypothetical protein